MTKFRISSIYLLHAITIFLSAFLVFQIQPILSKTLLPWFGGTSAVWATSLLFFSSALFVGYLYVFLISKQSQRMQAIIHLIFLALTFSFTIGNLIINSSLTIPLEWTQSSGASPSLIVILVLTASIGLPYVALSATSPLIQYWFGQSNEKESYHLYAISNAGSFLALMSYPFVFERIATLKNQQLSWALAFCIFIVFCSSISIRKIRTEPKNKTKTLVEKIKKADFRWKMWIAFSAFPAFMLVATTSSITQKIAPIPLLWVIPLAIYLLTYVFAFSGLGQGSFSYSVLGVGIATSISAIIESQNVLYVVFSFTLLLFAIGLTFHAKLYSYRPPKEYSTIFYLFTSIGGMTGTLIGSIIPPIIFNEIYEFKIGILMSGAFLAVYIYKYLVDNKKPRFQYISFAIIAMILLSMISLSVFSTNNTKAIFSSRSFYGALRVEEDATARYLISNEITQGFQFVDKDREFETAGFYLNDKAVLGKTIEYLRTKTESSSIKIGVVGLGVGVQAGQCKKNDELAFYEIDPNVEKVARKYFTFIENCKNVEIEIGDGRIALKNNLKTNDERKFDLIVVDAFNGGSIPTHLLTREAIEIYRSNLDPNHGIIGLHISNRYLDLKPLGKALAKDGNFSYLINVDTGGDSGIGTSIYTWAFLAKNPNTFESDEFKDISRQTNIKSIDVWTDQKTDIFSVLK